MTDIVQRLRAPVDESLPMVRRSEREEAANKIERLNKECSALAADQCHHGYGGEYGDHRCNYQDEIELLRKELAEADKLLSTYIDGNQSYWFVNSPLETAFVRHKARRAAINPKDSKDE